MEANITVTYTVELDKHDQSLLEDGKITPHDLDWSNYIDACCGECELDRIEVV